MAMGRAGLEVAAHPIAQYLGLADIENAIVTVAHQVATWLRGQVLEPLLQPLRLLEQRHTAEASRGVQTHPP